MASDDWQIVLEAVPERHLGKLENPSLIKEAREVIDDLQFDPVPPGAVKMIASPIISTAVFGSV